MTRPIQSLATSLIIMVVGISAQQAKTVAYEVILRHGTILDGTGLKPFRADLAYPKRLHSRNRRSLHAPSVVGS
jgi:hypothetical protein